MSLDTPVDLALLLVGFLEGYRFPASGFKDHLLVSTSATIFMVLDEQVGILTFQYFKWGFYFAAAAVEQQLLLQFSLTLKV